MMNRSITRNLAILILATMLIAMLSACSGGNNTPVITDQQNTLSSDAAPTTAEVTEAADPGSKSASAPSDSDFEIKEYLYETSYCTKYYLVVKNLSGVNVAISGNATAKDDKGNAIGAGDLSIDAVGPGQTSIGYFFFSDVRDVACVDYTLSYKTDHYYADVIADLQMTQTVNDQNVVVTVTNNGSEAAEFVEAFALFFDADGNVVYEDSKYLTDADYEIKPGATLSGQLNSYVDFDYAEVYLTGRRTSF